VIRQQWESLEHRLRTSMEAHDEAIGFLGRNYGVTFTKAQEWHRIERDAAKRLLEWLEDRTRSQSIALAFVGRKVPA
jgi:hypothetical protein